MKYIYKFLLLFIVFTCFGCASFSKREFRKEIKPLTDTTRHLLDGNYSFYPIKRYGKYAEIKNLDSLKYTNAYHEIINESWHKKQKNDSNLNKDSIYYIALKLERSVTLHIALFENETKLRDTVFNGKLKNGMFYIDNKFLQCYGIPYLFGGCQHNKRRIGVTKSHNLIINETFNNGGALLLFIGAGVGFNTTFEFERIK